MATPRIEQVSPAIQEDALSDQAADDLGATLALNCACRVMAGKLIAFCTATVLFVERRAGIADLATLSECGAWIAAALPGVG